MIEQLSGEAGVLRTALGVVLGMDGIDVRVRLYLWSGGVEDVTLPVVDARRLPQGAQVVVMFLSGRPQSGMVLGTVEGNLSWRRSAAPAFTDYLQPQLWETIAQAKALDASLSVTEGVFALDPEEGTGQFDGCVLMADGRVFFVPGEIGGGSALVRPHIWDPITGSIHAVPWDSPEPDEYRGGVLLRDGRVFFMPHPWTTVGQARIYDPALDRVIPAGQPLVTGCCGCVLLADGRVLMVPYDNPNPLIYDPESDTVTASQVTMHRWRSWRPCRISASWAMPAAWGCPTGGWCSARARHATWSCGIRAAALALGEMLS